MVLTKRLTRTDAITADGAWHRRREGSDRKRTNQALSTWLAFDATSASGSSLATRPCQRWTCWWTRRSRN